MHSGAGVGLRWSGVFGQVRLDLAKPLDQDGSWRIHFTLGADL
jgi:translocation and assembly module TamA